MAFSPVFMYMALRSKKRLVNETPPFLVFERHGFSDMYTETAVKAIFNHMASLIFLRSISLLIQNHQKPR